MSAATSAAVLGAVLGLGGTALALLVAITLRDLCRVALRQAREARAARGRPLTPR